MKNTLIKSFAILTFVALTAIFNLNVFAQTADNQTQSAVKIGVMLPKASFSEGTDNAQMAVGLREVIGEYFKGTTVEIVALEARLPQAIAAEAKEKGCTYILQTAVAQKKGGGGFGMFKALAPVLTSVVPMAGIGGSIAGQVVGQVAQTAIQSAATMSGSTKSKDQFTFEYSLVAAEGGAVKAASSQKAKAKSDGEDVISPMVEKMAEAILAAVK